MGATDARFVCGAECGIVAVGTISPAVEHWSTVTGTAPTVVTSGPSPMRSTRCFRFNPTAATSYFIHVLGTAVASPATIVTRFYVYFATLPSATVCLGPNFNNFGVFFHQPSSTLRAGGSTGAVAASGAAVTTGVWYRVDSKVAFTSPTWTADLQVDGTAQAQYSTGGSSVGVTSVYIGLQQSCTADVYIDDIIISGTSGDYPIGEGTVAGLYPTSDGAHVYNSTTDFGDGGSAVAALAASGSEVDTWSSLQNPLSTTIDTANYITNLAGATGEYLRWNADNLPSDASTVNGVAHVSTHHSSSATANSQSLFVVDQSAGGSTPSAVAKEITVLGTAAANVWATGVDLSETTIITVYDVAAVGETTGAWTVANVNDLGWVWGSIDVNPDPILDGLCLEVDHVAAPSGDATGTAGVVAVTTTRLVPTGSADVTPAVVQPTVSALAATGSAIFFANAAGITATVIRNAPTGAASGTVEVETPTVTRNVPSGGAGGTPGVFAAVATILQSSGSTAQTAQPPAVAVIVTRNVPTGGAGGTTGVVAPLLTLLAATGGISTTPAVLTAAVVRNVPTGGAGGTAGVLTAALSLLVPFGGAGSTTAQLVVIVATVQPTGTAGGTSGTGSAGVVLVTTTNAQAVGIVPTTAASFGTVLAEYDFSHPELITASGGAVSAVGAIWGTSGTVTQATAGSRPTTGTRISPTSLNMLDFDGGDSLAVTIPNLVQPFTIAIVASQDVSGGVQIIAAGTNISLASFSDQMLYYDNSGAGWSANGAPLPVGAVHVQLWAINGSSSNTYVDAGFADSTSGGAGDWGTTLSIGNTYNGAIGHVIIWDGTIAGQIAARAGLIAKWMGGQTGDAGAFPAVITEPVALAGAGGTANIGAASISTLVPAGSASGTAGVFAATAIALPPISAGGATANPTATALTVFPRVPLGGASGIAGTLLVVAIINAPTSVGSGTANPTATAVTVFPRIPLGGAGGIPTPATPTVVLLVPPASGTNIAAAVAAATVFPRVPTGHAGGTSTVTPLTVIRNIPTAHLGGTATTRLVLVTSNLGTGIAYAFVPDTYPVTLEFTEFGYSVTSRDRVKATGTVYERSMATAEEIGHTGSAYERQDWIATVGEPI